VVIFQENVSFDHYFGTYPVAANPPGELPFVAKGGTPSVNGLGGAAQGRCGYGPRMPLLVISPFAKMNFVDHAVTDLSSIPRFIEDNWQLGQIGGGSFDAIAGTLLNMFDFTPRNPVHRLFLDPSTGKPVPTPFNLLF